MLSKIKSFLLNPFAAICLLSISVVLISLILSKYFQFNSFWAYLCGAVTCFISSAALFIHYLIKKRKNKKLIENLAENIPTIDDEFSRNSSRKVNHDLRQRFMSVINLVKKSKLGDISGRTALYEVPWYIVIGSPAAGKSTAIDNSGLNFPLTESNNTVGVKGVGGTRNCDWFFSSDGVLIDTAGRYSIYKEDQNEWMYFLSLLKKSRPISPINGILVAASLEDFLKGGSEFAINYAKNIRERLQEITDNLNIFAPVYIVFTKTDILKGFVESFSCMDKDECSQIWGATLPYKDIIESSNKSIDLFDIYFDELYESLKEHNISIISKNKNKNIVLDSSLLGFPLEFLAVKPVLKTFIINLFEDNLFQHKPILRGFYFTSAAQLGKTISRVSQNIIHHFNLANANKKEFEVESYAGYFLKNLFLKVIFADKKLVRHYISNRKKHFKVIGFSIAAFIFSCLAGAWAWSFQNNLSMIESVKNNFVNIQKRQESKHDLNSTLQNLVDLQDQIETLQNILIESPFKFSMGLSQAQKLQNQLKKEYFLGAQKILFEPVTKNLELFLNEVYLNSAKLQIKPSANQDNNSASAASHNQAFVPTDIEDAYNALKTYIMLGDPQYLEAPLLSDQLTRFWIEWLENNKDNTSDELIRRNAEKILSFIVTQIKDPDFPVINKKLVLEDQVRSILRQVYKGLPAIERVYTNIKQQAHTRFNPVTVLGIIGENNKNLFSGSYVIDGTFTKEAWSGFIYQAIKGAANKESQNADWVLKSNIQDDLTLEGSPENIQKRLTSMYKAEYIKEWQRFIQGISIAEFNDFDGALNGFNRLGDVNSSPLLTLLSTLFRQTSWDNSKLSEQINALDKLDVNLGINTNLNKNNLMNNLSKLDGLSQNGQISNSFAHIAKLVVLSNKENNSSNLVQGYLAYLRKISLRFNEIKSSGDLGHSAKILMQKTVEGSSEFAETWQFAAGQMFSNNADAAQQALSSLFTQPLVYGFSSLTPLAENELNKIWVSQVYEPFMKNLSDKAPFNPKSAIGASEAEIAKTFSPDGEINKFFEKEAGNLIRINGGIISATPWKGITLNINYELIKNYPRYIVNSSGSSANNIIPAGFRQFQILPVSNPDITEYKIDVGGQIISSKSKELEWSYFLWPSPSNQKTIKIIAKIAKTGNVVEVLNLSGDDSIKNLYIQANKTKEISQNEYELTWGNPPAAVSIKLKAVLADTSNNPKKNGLNGLSLLQKIFGKIEN